MSENNGSEDILSYVDQSVEVPSKLWNPSEHLQQNKDVAPLREDTDDDKKDKAIEGEVELRTTAEEERLTGKRLHQERVVNDKSEQRAKKYVNRRKNKVYRKLAQDTDEEYRYTTHLECFGAKKGGSTVSAVENVTNTTNNYEMLIPFACR